MQCRDMFIELFISFVLLSCIRLILKLSSISWHLRFICIYSIMREFNNIYNKV